MSDLVTVEDFHERARSILPQAVYDYYAGGAGDEWTLRENRLAFERVALVPRVLVDVSKVDLSTMVLGHPVMAPGGHHPVTARRSPGDRTGRGTPPP